MNESLGKKISYIATDLICSAGLEVDDESPGRNDIVLALLAQRCAIVRRIYSVVVTQLRPQRNRKKKVKRRPDIHAATELCCSGIPVNAGLGAPLLSRALVSSQP